MKVLNFDWTDKHSVRWFVLLVDGHEGPYSLNRLIGYHSKGTLKLEEKIWCEGLVEPVSLRIAIDRANAVEEEVPPPLPPLPTQEESQKEPESIELPPIPKIKEEKKISLQRWIGILLGILSFFLITIVILIKSHETISLERPPKMPAETFERVKHAMVFEGWGKKIFFKEFLPPDYSEVWFYTNSFQSCEVSLVLRSIDEKLLSVDNSKVVAHSNGRLSRHFVHFRKLNFSKGTKIIPGLYDADIKAYDCEWDGWIPWAANLSKNPQQEYISRTKVILFSRGPDEFNRILSKLAQKKLEEEQRTLHAHDAFWQDLQQKWQTLLAMTLQIEQIFIDHLKNDRAKFSQLESKYSSQYGTFLTAFLEANEAYFMKAPRDFKWKRDYSAELKTTTLKLGELSAQSLEEIQELQKNPKKIKSWTKDFYQRFDQFKDFLNKKIIEISEDRSSQKP